MENEKGGGQFVSTNMWEWVGVPCDMEQWWGDLSVLRLTLSITKPMLITEDQLKTQAPPLVTHLRLTFKLFTDFGEVGHPLQDFGISCLVSMRWLKMKDTNKF